MLKSIPHLSSSSTYNNIIMYVLVIVIFWLSAMAHLPTTSIELHKEQILWDMLHALDL